LIKDYSSENDKIYDIIKDFNKKIYDDNILIELIKKAIKIKIELDFCCNLICKYGTKIEQNICTICYTNKISCCYIPCGHVYC
jgi:hypothetical protein